MVIIKVVDRADKKDRKGFVTKMYICMSTKAVQIKKRLIIHPSNFTKNTFLFTVTASGTKRRVSEGYA